jgi:lysophospholipase L1-like esterase
MFVLASAPRTSFYQGYFNLKQQLMPAKQVLLFGDSLVTDGFAKHGFIDILRSTQADMPLCSFKNLGANGQGIEKIFSRFISFINSDGYFSRFPTGANSDNQDLKECDVFKLEQGFEPTSMHIVIFAGINDAWKYRKGKGAALDIFEQVMLKFLKKALTLQCRVTYFMPHFIAIKSEHNQFEFDRILQQYLVTIKQITTNIAADHSLFQFIALRDVLGVDSIGLERAAKQYTRDGVHFNHLGQTLIAKELLKALS